MVNKIKGPIKITGGTDELLDIITKKIKTKIKLPFTATGWESTEGMKHIPESFKKKPKKANKRTYNSQKKSKLV